MTEISLRVAVRDDGRYVYKCGRTPDGIAWEPVGCEHDRPKQASQHRDRLLERAAQGEAS